MSGARFALPIVITLFGTLAVRKSITIVVRHEIATSA